MNERRTGGMTAIGVLNIVFGSLGCLAGLLIVVAGGIFAAAGAGMESEGAEGAAEFGGAIGGIAALLGLFILVMWGAVIFAGIGVLKVVPWGRTLSIICGVILLLVSAVGVMLNGINVGGLLTTVYACTLIGLMLKPDWKAAFDSDLATPTEEPVTIAPPGMPSMASSPSVAGMPPAAPKPLAEDDAQPAPTGLPGMPPPGQSADAA